MNPWTWYRRRSWGVRLAAGIPAAAVVLAILYTAARGLQYASDPGSAGMFAPAGADVVIRVRDLEGNWERIRETSAWRTIERKILKDPAVRKSVNNPLSKAALPTLDDLQDVRKMGRDLEANIMRGAGRDFMAAVEGTHFCAATRMRFVDFLGAPLAGFVFETETVGGRAVLRAGNVFAVIVGSFAVVSDDPALLEAALKRGGDAKAPAGIVEARFDLEGKDPSPWLDLHGGAALDVSLDVADSALVATVALDGAAWAGAEPPVDRLRMAPAAAGGFAAWSVEPRKVWDWLLDANADSKNLGESLRTLEKAGMATSVLPFLGSAAAVFTGGVDVGGKVYPGVVCAFPSTDAQGAVAALENVMGKVDTGQLVRESFRSGDAEIVVWRASFLTDSPWQTPCYAALPGVFLLGNNDVFLDSVVQAANGGGLTQQGAFRALGRRAAECGLNGSPGLVLFPAIVKESIDPVLSRIARNAVDAVTKDAQLRAEVESDFRKEGRRSVPGDVNEATRAAKERLYRHQEDQLRDAMRALDFVKWIAVEYRGLQFKVVLELR